VGWFALCTDRAGFVRHGHVAASILPPSSADAVALAAGSCSVAAAGLLPLGVVTGQIACGPMGLGDASRHAAGRP